MPVLPAPQLHLLCLSLRSFLSGMASAFSNALRFHLDDRNRPESMALIRRESASVIQIVCQDYPISV